ncbi:MAG: pimeloyl-ACP methyl ester carboxylesterase [Flavobacteriales bacterium]
MNKSNFIFNNYTHEYLTIGENSNHSQKAIIAFHGFGRKAEDFRIFESCLSEDQIIYSFNLIGHGNSKFTHDQQEQIDPLAYSEFILAFANFKNFSKFSLLGYSLGGKICMMLLQHLSQHIDGFMLIAPDGVKVNRYYRFASSTAIGKWLFNLAVDYPAPVLRVTDFLKFIGIFNNRLHKFIYINMEERATRALVREVWIIYARFLPNIKLVQELLNEHVPHTVLIYGLHDSVIKLWQGEKLNRGLKKSSLHVLDTGHLLLEGRTIAYLEENDLWFPPAEGDSI